MSSSRRFVVISVVIALALAAGRIRSQDYSFKVQVVSQVNGLRVQTDLPGGQVASFAAVGDFQVDAPFLPGGRFSVRETGQVGIGTASPSSQLHVRVPASTTPISAATVDVVSYSTAGNAQASHFFRVRDIGANAPSAFIIRGDGNVGIGTDAPPEKLTVTGIVRSTSGGFRFPDGSVQTSADAVTYTTDCFIALDLTTSPQSICRVILPVGTFLLRAMVLFDNSSNNSGSNNNRRVDCSFSGESLVYTNDIPGPSGLSVTLNSVLTVTSGGVDLNCSSNQTGVGTSFRRLTARQLNGSVIVQ